MFVTKPLVPPWTDSGKLVPRALARASSGRHELHVLVSSGDAAAWPSWVRPHAVYGGAGRYRPGAGEHLRMMLAVWRRRARFDALHFFFQPHPNAVGAARVLARACGRPSVHTVMSAPPAPQPGLLFADRSVALTQATAGRFAQAGGRCDAVIPPALDETAPAGEDRAARARDALGLSAPFVLYPGDFEFSGGHDVLIEAWSRARDLPDLVMTGRAKTPRAAAAQAGIAAAVERRGLGARIRIAGTVGDMPGLLAASTALLFPARSLHAKTDLPLVVLEAWREGRPVLASDLPPLVECIGAGGRTLPLEPDAWIEAVRGLGAEGGRMGAEGRRRFDSEYAAPAAARSYEALYDDLAAGRARETT